MPARGEGASIAFDDALTTADDIYFQPFTISEPSFFSGQITTGFFPVLTLFAADDSATPQFLYSGDGLGYKWLTEFQTFTNTISFDPPDFDPPFELTLATGTRYLLALSQQPFLFSPSTGTFDSVDPELAALIAGCREAGLGEFIDADNQCGDGQFSGTLSVEPTSVPEPATCALLALGGAALIARRRGREHGDT
jgi:hypothetical protein